MIWNLNDSSILAMNHFEILFRIVFRLGSSPVDFVALDGAQELYDPVVCGAGSTGVLFVGSAQGQVYAIRSAVDSSSGEWRSKLIWTADAPVAAGAPTCSADYVYFVAESQGFYAFRIGYYSNAAGISVAVVFALVLGVLLF